MKQTLLALALMTFCSVAAADQPPFEVKGIRLGVASAADVTERFQLDALHDPSVYVMPCLTESCFIIHRRRRSEADEIHAHLEPRPVPLLH